MNINETRVSTENGEACPVNLVTRIKYEAKEPPPLTTHTSITSSSSSLFFPISSPSSATSTSLLHDLHNCFRRRKRGRYSHASSFNFSLLPPPPSPTSSTSSKKALLSDYSSASLLYHQKPISISSSSSSSISASSSFACPNCKLHFSNRDSLAMHMMESVRLEGCCHSLTNSTQGPPVTTSITTSTSSIPLKAPTLHKSVPPPAQTPLFCKVCHDPFLTLDSLAMHMFLHISEPPTQPVPYKYTPTTPYFKSLIDATLLESSPSSENLKVTTNSNNKPLEDNNSSTDPKVCPISPTIKSAVPGKFKPTNYPERNCFSAPSIDEKNIDNHNDEDDSRSCQKLTVSLPTKETCRSTLEENVKEDVVQSSSLGTDNDEDGELEILGKLNKCIHCRILFEDPTVYCLHMGLHNVNDPWQCNMCGRKCEDLYDFTVHSLHF